MAEDKKSFVLYADLIHTVRKLPKEKQGELFMTILSYVNDENPQVDDLLVELVFEPVKLQLKRDLAKYQTTKERRKEAGRLAGLKSGEVRKGNVPETNQNEPMRTNGSKNEPNEPVTVNDNDTVNVTVTVNDTVTDILLEKETKNNNSSFDFKKSLINYGFEKNLVEDWMKVRKTKRATNTKTAFDAFIKEIESRSCNINEMLQIAVTNSWSGFKFKWVDNLKVTNKNGASAQSNTEIAINAYNSEAARNFRFK